MPSVSGTQQRMMAAAYRRRLAGRPRSTDPKMSVSKLHDFTRKVPGAPERASGYGKGPVSEGT
jgi:hypothetical protein